MPVGRDPIASGRRLRMEQFSVACLDLGLRDAFALRRNSSDAEGAAAVTPKTRRLRHTAA